MKWVLLLLAIKQEFECRTLTCNEVFLLSWYFFGGGIWIYFFHCCTSGVEVNTIKTPEMYRRRSCDSFSSGQEMSVLLHATAAHVATQQLSGVTYMVDAWWNSLRRAVCRRRPPPSSCYKQVSHEEEGGHQGKMYREQQAWIHTGGIKALWRRPKQGYFNNVFHFFFSVLRSFFFCSNKKICSKLCIFNFEK